LYLCDLAAEFSAFSAFNAFRREKKQSFNSARAAGRILEDGEESARELEPGRTSGSFSLLGEMW
jgi:hypothetical protein